MTASPAPAPAPSPDAPLRPLLAPLVPQALALLGALAVTRGPQPTPAAPVVPSAGVLDALVWGPPLAALGVGALTLLVLGRRGPVNLRAPMRAVTWSAGTSWVSHFAFAATTYGALVGLLGEDQKGAFGGAFAILAVTFGLLALAAPLVYRLTLNRLLDDPGGPGEHGPVWGYLLASGLTLWSACGNLALLELARQAAVQPYAASLLPPFLGLLLGGLAVIVLLFAVLTVADTVRDNAPPPQEVMGPKAAPAPGGSLL